LIENYCIVASSVLLWFDCAQTFPDECRKIWGRKFSGATVIYLSTRYLAVVERIFFVAAIMTWNSSDQVCSGLTHTDSTLLFLSYLSIASFTALRVYAIWGRDWRPLTFVLPLGLIRPALTLYEASSYTAVQSGPRLGCGYNYSVSSAMLAGCAPASVIATDAVLIALTWRKTYGIQRVSMKTGVRTPLATLLLRDGESSQSTLLSHALNHSIHPQRLTFSGVWPFFDQTFSVIFLSRFMLNLRGLYFTDKDATETRSTLRWSDVLTLRGLSSHVVGNLGATLSVRDEEALGRRGGRGHRSGGADGEEEGGRYDEWIEDEVDEEAEAEEVPAFVADPFHVGMGDPVVGADAGASAVGV
ncbi:hypothetical protein C8Q78DRAFT_977588, partial [Trametes maxima]